MCIPPSPAPRTHTLTLCVHACCQLLEALFRKPVWGQQVLSAKEFCKGPMENTRHSLNNAES